MVGGGGAQSTRSYQLSPSQGLLQTVDSDTVSGGDGVAEGGVTGILWGFSDAARATVTRQTKLKYFAIIAGVACEAHQLQQYHFGSAVVL